MVHIKLVHLQPSEHKENFVIFQLNANTFAYYSVPFSLVCEYIEGGNGSAEGKWGVKNYTCSWIIIMIFTVLTHNIIIKKHVQDLTSFKTNFSASIAL